MWPGFRVRLYVICVQETTFMVSWCVLLNQDRGPTWKPARAEVAFSLNNVTFINSFIVGEELFRRLAVGRTIWVQFSSFHNGKQYACTLTKTTCSVGVLVGLKTWGVLDCLQTVFLYLKGIQHTVSSKDGASNWLWSRQSSCPSCLKANEVQSTRFRRGLGVGTRDHEFVRSMRGLGWTRVNGWSVYSLSTFVYLTIYWSRRKVNEKLSCLSLLTNVTLCEWRIVCNKTQQLSFAHFYAKTSTLKLGVRKVLSINILFILAAILKHLYELAL